MANQLPYELESLSRAKEYQKWLYELVAPFLGKRILEVGSGIGNMSTWLPVGEHLTLSEADENLLPYLLSKVADTHGTNPNVEVFKINLDSSDWVSELKSRNFDTIISFNVMEHIREDQQSYLDFYNILKGSASKATKKIITVAPAHQWAFGTFDSVFNHFRRYSAKDFKKIQNECLKDANLHIQYFNLIGLFGWVTLGKILKKKNLSNTSVEAFEKICPIVKPFDNFIHQKMRLPIGQSILSVYSFD